MDHFYAYHAVTERPMALGQRLIFDADHPNGVAARVDAFSRIMAGEPLEGATADLIRANPDRWAKVAYRELALERVRTAEFPQYPSRMACLYTTQTYREAAQWADYFAELGRTVYGVVRLRVEGRCFIGDATACFDGLPDEAANLPLARRYWLREPTGRAPIDEMLVDGVLTVEEISPYVPENTVWG